MLGRQRAIVEERARAAALWDYRRRQHAAALRQWKQEHFARPSTLVAAFAAGAVIGASRETGLRRFRPSEHMVGLANSALLAWRLFGAHD
jgi:hypothetical protein